MYNDSTENKIKSHSRKCTQSFTLLADNHKRESSLALFQTPPTFKKGPVEIKAAASVNINSYLSFFFLPLQPHPKPSLSHLLTKSFTCFRS